MTPADIIYHRRLGVLEHAARCQNGSEACPHGFPRRTSRTKSSVRAPAAAAGRFATEGYATVYDGVIGPWSGRSSCGSPLHRSGIRRRR